MDNIDTLRDLVEGEIKGSGLYKIVVKRLEEGHVSDIPSTENGDWTYATISYGLVAKKNKKVTKNGVLSLDERIKSVISNIGATMSATPSSEVLYELEYSIEIGKLKVEVTSLPRYGDERDVLQENRALLKIRLYFFRDAEQAGKYLKRIDTEDSC